MYGTARATQYGYSLWEFDVYTTGSGGGGTGNTVTVTNPGSQSSTVGTAASLQVHATDSASGQTLTYSASGLPAGLSINSSSGLISGTADDGQYHQCHGDRHRHHGGSRDRHVQLDRGHRQASGVCPAQSNTPNFGPNVYIFDPSMSSATIQTTLNTVFNTQKLNQFGTQRYALLFKPGTYSAEANIGYYTSIQGLGQNPDDVTINGDVTVDSFDGTGNATQNFWRSAENLAINPSAGNDRWAVAQAGPFRRIDVHGGLELYPASYGYASGGYIADTKVSGQVSSVSQQQWYSAGQQLRQLERLGVEHGVLRRDRRAGAELPEPADDHAGHHPGRRATCRTCTSTPAATTTCSCRQPADQRVRRQLGQRLHPRHLAADEPVLRGRPRPTPRRQINAALAQGCNLFFTPGVYTSTRRSTSPTRTRSCSASASRP